VRLRPNKGKSSVLVSVEGK